MRKSAISRPRPLSMLLLLTVMAVAVWSRASDDADGGSATEAPFSTADSGWEGLSEFVRLGQRQLGTERVRVVGQLDYESLTHQDAVVIVHPTVDVEAESITAFLADGGRVAVVDDLGHGAKLLERFSIHRIPAPLEPRRMLRGNPQLAIAEPITQVVAGAERGRHPMTEKVEEVVTNHPRGLSHPDLTPILEIRDESGAAIPIAVTGIIAGKGRFLAISDPSIFINLMLRYPGNRALTRGLFDYVASRSDQGASDQSSQRTPASGKVYVVSGAFGQIGTYGASKGLLDELREALGAAEQAVRDVKDKGLPPALSLILAALLGIWAIGPLLRDELPIPLFSRPAFARPVPLAAGLGLSARAEILSTANPLLAVIEMDSALREAISARVGVNPSSRKDQLQAELEQSGLSADDSAASTRLLAELRQLGQSLAEGRPARTSPAQLERLHQESMRLLSQIKNLGRNQ